MTPHAPPRSARRLVRRPRLVLPAVVPDDPAAARSSAARGADVAVSVFAFGIGAATLADTWGEHPPWLRVIAIAVGLATVLALRHRREHPAAVGIGIGLVSLVILTASGATLVATYNAAVRARGRDLAVVAGLAVAWALVNPLLYPPDGGYRADAAASLLLAAVALGWGLFARARRDLVRSLHALADRAGDEARSAERRRIAGEMHDVLAHRLTLLSLHAGALEFRPGEAAADDLAEAAGVVRESARAALEELRDVIGVLREDGESLTAPPQPTLADLPALVEESRAAGMRVTARIDVGDAVPGAAVGRTAFRVAQEGLTNARKHAPAAAVTLTVAAPADGLRIEVRSLAPVAVAAPGTRLPGAGTGLIGLAERVTLTGGELESGVDADGAFVLRARLPR